MRRRVEILLMIFVNFCADLSSMVGSVATSSRAFELDRVGDLCPLVN